MNPFLGTQFGCCGAYDAFCKKGPDENFKSEAMKTMQRYPFGTTPVKYTPSGSSSINRAPWEGWRYGTGYIGPNEGMVYGEPDYKYYRHNYCGPCGCAPPGYRGDPNGQNPNIRYVQLDYNNLLGSGFATQNASPQFMKGTPPFEQTGCGKEHCQSCSGVYKAAKQPVKFQVCIGDPNCPSTMPPCPQQPLQVYVPTQMMPKEGEKGSSGDNDDTKDGEEKKLQDFEVHIPGMTDKFQNSTSSTSPDFSGDSGDAPPPRRSYLDPCGNCKTCKIVKQTTNSPDLYPPPMAQAFSSFPPPPQEWEINGQKYTSGCILQSSRKPFRPAPLKK